MWTIYWWKSFWLLISRLLKPSERLKLKLRERSEYFLFPENNIFIQTQIIGDKGKKLHQEVQEILKGKHGTGLPTDPRRGKDENKEARMADDVWLVWLNQVHKVQCVWEILNDQPGIELVSSIDVKEREEKTLEDDLVGPLPLVQYFYIFPESCWHVCLLGRVISHTASCLSAM